MMHLWHSWGKWQDRERATRYRASEIENARAAGFDTSKVGGMTMIVQERRCLKCNVLALRTVVAE